MQNLIATIIAQLADVSAVQVLMVVNGGVTLAIGAVYRDCRLERAKSAAEWGLERAKMWTHIRELERKLGA